MLINETTAIVTRKTILVPYRTSHVERYNQWMQSEELRERTASEPLTLEEEYEMQAKWRLDNDKLTFIILARPEGSFSHTKAFIDTLPMVGDVNIFLTKNAEDEDEAEVEVMIAETTFQRQGLAFSAVSALLHYVINHKILPNFEGLGHEEISPSMLVARIGGSNTASISLFKKLGFRIVKPENVFGEVELRVCGDTEELMGHWEDRGEEIGFSLDDDS
ncbi:hypothetical protein FRB91_008827 [Serendipita sp. 411]|nr:hypothetical protein FRC15_003308 [Serendipita sp. 397]KAG8824009.1 hypothetical protein FRC19_002738 [Serendipita sp. 401]KAG8859151.1 hypothetical protein FRB91_008827 [Serendipita sp. 411]KAG8868353.1 hypothetical protein FRC20_003563 [Serendipita sp. 405]